MNDNSYGLQKLYEKYLITNELYHCELYNLTVISLYLYDLITNEFYCSDSIILSHHIELVNCAL